jgi:ABC-type uncharacterized transport system fused permease/ATPase subunit
MAYIENGEQPYDASQPLVVGETEGQ